MRTHLAIVYFNHNHYYYTQVWVSFISAKSDSTSSRSDGTDRTASVPLLRAFSLVHIRWLTEWEKPK